MKLKITISVVLAALLVTGGVIYLKPLFSGKHSKIIRETTVKHTNKDGNTIIEAPEATLPVAADDKNWSTLKGIVAMVSNDPENPNATDMVVLFNGDEIIVPTNIPFVHTLQYFYVGKNVRLSGEWKKDAIIFGKKYRSFWIEDIELDKGTIQ